MNQIFRNSLLFASLALLPTAGHSDDSKILYKDLVQPILTAKCVQCHGEEKQKGKLRLDSLEAILQGSDGENVIPGKIDDSLLTFRVTLPKDDDEVMPPEDEPQLTEAEIEVLKFWVQAGAKGDGKIGDLKPAGAVANAIKAVLANPPKAPAGVAAADAPKEVDPAQLKLAEETIGRVEKEGASLMAIAQDTPDLRFSALNVAKEYGDKNLELLKPVANQVKWMDLARTQVTDAGLANLAGMKNLTRLHLENTKITDAGLEHLKGLANLEYLNLYGTQVTDAGIQKLAGLKNLKKLFVWQTKVTDAGAQKLAGAVAGIDINTGWKEPAKPVTVAANTPKPASPAAPNPAPAAEKKPTPAPAKPDPTKKPEPDKVAAAAKPAPAPAKNPEPTKPTSPKPASTPAKKPEPAKPAATPTASFADLGAAISKALDDAKAASHQAKTTAAAANTAAANAAKVSGDAQKVAAAAKGASDKAHTVSNEAKGASDNAVKAANEAKSVAAAAQKTAAEAQKAANEAKQAAAAAQKAAADATKVAQETKGLLMELQKAAAAIIGATDK